MDEELTFSEDGIDMPTYVNTIRKIQEAHKYHCNTAALHLKAHQDAVLNLEKLQDQVKLMISPPIAGSGSDIKGQALMQAVMDTDRWFQQESHTAIAMGMLLGMNAENTMSTVKNEIHRLREEEDAKVADETPTIIG